MFSLKALEVSWGRTLAPRLRERLDGYALAVKRFGIQTGRFIEQLPYVAVWALRRLVHLFAVAMAAVARVAERRAHQLADLVSHKHLHERREQKPQEGSHFLSQVSEETNIEERSEQRPR